MKKINIAVMMVATVALLVGCAQASDPLPPPPPPEVIEYTVTFNVDGGTEVASQTIVEGECATQPSSAPTKTGYTFEGWDFDFDTAITADTTVNAIWSINSYTITFNIADCDEEMSTWYPLDPITVDYNTPVDLTSHVPSKRPKASESVQHLGWSLTRGGEIITPHTITMGASNITLYDVEN